MKLRADSLVGLPYVCLVEDARSGSRFVCQLRSGQKMRAREVEEIFNAGLLIEAMEGPGSAARQTVEADGASKLHAEMLAAAEKLFGITIQDAFPIYQAMDRYEYGRWEDRPRVKWPRPQVN
jgi:hypothetical protein